MKQEKEIYDLTIIGGGPAGLFASFYAGLRELKVKIIEAQPKLGGKVHVYPEKMIWDVGGLTPVPGKKLIEQLIEQGLTFSPAVALSETVQSMEKDEEGVFCIRTSKQTHYSRTVLLAIGGGIIDPVKLDVENAQEFEESNLHYHVKRLKDFEGKKVLISGGGNSAIDWANALAPIAEKVTLVYRGESWKGHEKDVSNMVESGIDYYTNTQIEELIGEAGKIRTAVIRNNVKAEPDRIAVDAVIVNHGYNRNQDLMTESNLEVSLKDDYFIEGNAASESSVAGLYAAGDILSYEGKLHLIAGAFQDAANAVNSAKKFLEPDANETAMVSSHHEAFKEKNKQYMYN